MSNDAQKEFWNGPAGDMWVEAQNYLDDMLAPLSQMALDKAAVSTGERAIDIGCGCGATALALADAGAAVWGLDISAPMVARAKQRAQDRERLAFSVGDAATAELAPDHHLLFSRFGVMFFADPKAAFTNLRTGLVSGGRLVFVCWQSPAANPWMAVPGAAAKPFMPPADAQDPRAPGPFAFADPDWVREILQDAGFTGIEIESITPELNVGQSLDEAMNFQLRVGPMARALADLDEGPRQQASQAVRDALSAYATADGVKLGSAGWLVSART